MQQTSSRVASPQLSSSVLLAASHPCRPSNMCVSATVHAVVRQNFCQRAMAQAAPLLAYLQRAQRGLLEAVPQRCLPRQRPASAKQPLQQARPEVAQRNLHVPDPALRFLQQTAARGKL